MLPKVIKTAIALQLSTIKIIPMLILVCPFRTKALTLMLILFKCIIVLKIYKLIIKAKALNLYKEISMK